MKVKSNKMNINNVDEYITVHTQIFIMIQPLHGGRIYLNATNK